MSLEEKIQRLEAELKAARKEKRLLNFDDKVVFENNCIVIEKRGRWKYDVLIKFYFGEPRREVQQTHNGKKFIETQRCSRLGIWKIEDFDTAIKALEEAKDFCKKELSN